jgi:hypothetical protein
MTALALIQGLPGGPYRLTITEPPDAPPSFSGDAMCTCDGAAHWHFVTAAPSLDELVAELLARHLQGTPS